MLFTASLNIAIIAAALFGKKMIEGYMAGEPVTIGPLPRKAVNITAEELLNAVVQFLAMSGIEVRTTDFEGSDGATFVQMRGVTELGVPWEPPQRYIFFTIDGKAFRSLNSRLGSGPFSLLIKASIHLEGEQSCRINSDVVAVPNSDRSITFRPVKRRDKDFVYF